MQTFSYRATNSTGARRNGILQAENISNALNTLKNGGLHPLEIFVQPDKFTPPLKTGALDTGERLIRKHFLNNHSTYRTAVKPTTHTKPAPVLNQSGFVSSPMLVLFLQVIISFSLFYLLLIKLPLVINSHSVLVGKISSYLTTWLIPLVLIVIIGYLCVEIIKISQKKLD